MDDFQSKLKCAQDCKILSSIWKVPWYNTSKTWEMEIEFIRKSEPKSQNSLGFFEGSSLNLVYFSNKGWKHVRLIEKQPSQIGICLLPISRLIIGKRECAKLQYCIEIKNSRSILIINNFVYKNYLQHWNISGHNIDENRKLSSNLSFFF